MCVMSMVHDHFGQSFPNPPQWPWHAPAPSIDLDEMRRLITEFKEAVAAAAKLDAILKQPNCLDPEKAKLQERVDRLERYIDALLADRQKEKA